MDKNKENLYRLMERLDDVAFLWEDTADACEEVGEPNALIAVRQVRAAAEMVLSLKRELLTNHYLQENIKQLEQLLEAGDFIKLDLGNNHGDNERNN